jgi:hypothetical protein
MTLSELAEKLRDISVNDMGNSQELTEDYEALETAAERLAALDALMPRIQHAQRLEADSLPEFGSYEVDKVLRDLLALRGAHEAAEDDDPVCRLGEGHACNSACGYCGRCCSCNRGAHE